MAWKQVKAGAAKCKGCSLPGEAKVLWGSLLPQSSFAGPYSSPKSKGLFRFLMTVRNAVLGVNWAEHGEIEKNYNKMREVKCCKSYNSANVYIKVF